MAEPQSESLCRPPITAERQRGVENEMIHLYNFINSNLFALIFIVLCGGGIVGIITLALCRCSKNREELESKLK